MDPFGEEIWFEHPLAGSGGLLDVDANAACGEARRNPVENIFWPRGAAPRGEYRVYEEKPVREALKSLGSDVYVERRCINIDSCWLITQVHADRKRGTRP
jgi:hypothetical protein